MCQDGSNRKILIFQGICNLKGIMEVAVPGTRVTKGGKALLDIIQAIIVLNFKGMIVKLVITGGGIEVTKEILPANID